MTKAEIDNKGKLTIDLADLIESLSIESKETIALHIACAGDIIKAVTDQIVDGMTFDKEGLTWCGYGVDEAQRRVIKAASDLYKQEIERMERQIEAVQKQSNEGWKKYHDLLKQRSCNGHF